MSQVPATARHAVFAPLEGGGRTDAVVRRLGEAVSLGLLADGEQLPAESDLSASLGVSTVTLREALATLREQGVVETRRGRRGGSFVRSPADPSTRRLRERLRETTPDELRDLGDVHRAVAGTAALLAAERAGPEEARRLAQHAGRLSTATSAARRRRADGRFHVEVAAAAQSPRLTRQEMELQAEVGELLWLPAGGALDAAEGGRQHAEIAAAIGRGDGPTARTLAEEHVLHGVEHLVALHLRLVRPG